MEQMVGEYPSLAEAEMAVRSLERRGLSIQNVYIVDERHNAWRSVHAPWAKRTPFSKRFAQIMRDTKSALDGLLDLGARPAPFAVLVRGTQEEVSAMERMLTHAV